MFEVTVSQEFVNESTGEKKKAGVSFRSGVVPNSEAIELAAKEICEFAKSLGFSPFDNEKDGL